MKLVLVRGLPGSGKSTFARELVGYHHVETDMWFTHGGNYTFNPASLPQAHKWCQQNAQHYLHLGKNVVVSNTFTQLWEMEPYFKMGADTVTIVECTGSYGNVHGVPEDKVMAMADRWQKVTLEWLSAQQSASVPVNVKT